MNKISRQLGAVERKAGLSLALIYAFRMVGLFMILPVFTLHADQLVDTTPVLIGLALGIYGLTQALLQIPFGLISDRIGRKPVIAGGLLLFALGSLIAASSESIYGIIAGRALQGSGAIAAALMALAADLSREEHRTKMMALIGASIGVSFALSMVLGPLVYQAVGLSGIFTLTAGLAVVGIVILFTLVPDPIQSRFHLEAEVETASVKSVLLNPELLRFDLGIFLLHFSLMCLFLVVPAEITEVVQLQIAEHWKLYLPVFVASVFIMLPFIVLSERKQMVKQVFLGAIVLMFCAVIGLHQSFEAGPLILFITLFFAAFNFLEASLPSLVSKTANATKKGTAMGVYSSSQFLGAFTGGLIGGISMQVFGDRGVYLTVAAVLVFWFIIALSMSQPKQLSTLLLQVADVSVEQLLDVQGVLEASIIRENGEVNVAYLKVNKKTLDEDKLSLYAYKYSA